MASAEMASAVGKSSLATRQQEYEADKKLMAQLDARTKVPHLLIELRSLGFIEICGKDLGGIYARLEEWFRLNWGCEFEQFKNECDRLCDASYAWDPVESGCSCLFRPRNPSVFKFRGDSGENNMGKLTMQIINFMCNTCGWGLKLCNGTNLGLYGSIREQQIKFKAPHPLNLIAPHLMIELRQSGWIEVNGPNTNGIHEKLGMWLADNWGAKNTKADEEYCDLKFACNCFKVRGTEGENNMGLRTMQIVDFMVKHCAWTMITCNGGNYGRCGDIREQQLVFRNDDHVQHGEDHVMVELRDVGYIEVNGLSSSPEIEPHLDKFIKDTWGCTDYKPGIMGLSKEKFCDHKYTAPPSLYYKEGLTNNIGKLTIQLSMFMASQGWMLSLCNGGHTSQLNSLQNELSKTYVIGNEIDGKLNREQQVKFTKARQTENANAPLLMIELRSIPNPKKPELMRPARYREAMPHVTQTNALKQVKTMIDTTPFEGLIEVNGPNTNGVYEKLSDFFQQHMKGKSLGRKNYCDYLYSCDVLRSKKSKDPHKMNYGERWEGYYIGENNMGKYTMRICDFLVDHVGEWDLIVCNGNSMERAWFTWANRIASFCAREQQLVFRHRPGGRAVFMSSVQQHALGRAPLQAPAYWKEAAREGTTGPEVVAATDGEKEWLQQLLDLTFKNKATRDRRGGVLANRFVVTAAVRSEHGQLWDAYAQRRARLAESSAIALEDLVAPKTMTASGELAARCEYAGISSPANEAYLMHGTNPTSAIAILGTSFKIDLAGKSAGTMFGPGAYLAEASSKADEYAADDKGGAYDGLYAMLVSRAVLGRSYVTEQPGDYKEKVLSGEFESVVGDREKAVGTYREFILFHEDSIYPEFAVFYRRDMSSA